MRKDYRRIAGDSFVLSGTATADLTGAVVRATVKRRLRDSDVAALSTVSTTDGGIVVSDFAFTVTFTAPMTETWPAGLRWYDVQAVMPGGTVWTLVQRGLLTVRRRITRTRTAA